MYKKNNSVWSGIARQEPLLADGSPGFVVETFTKCKSHFDNTIGLDKSESVRQIHKSFQFLFNRAEILFLDFFEKYCLPALSLSVSELRNAPLYLKFSTKPN